MIMINVLFSDARFLHVLESDVNEAAASRRGSVPVVSSSSASYAANAQPVRRGSEPTLPITVRQEWSRGGISVNVANSQHSTRHRVLGVAQEQLPGINIFPEEMTILNVSPSRF